MTGRIPGDIALLRNAILWRRKGLALFHSRIEGLPGPVLGAVHLSEHVFPGIDLDFARSRQIESIDSGTACCPR